MGLRPGEAWPNGDVAQLGEHLLCTQGVVGSNPIVSRRPRCGVAAEGSSREVTQSAPLAVSGKDTVDGAVGVSVEGPIAATRWGSAAAPCGLCQGESGSGARLDAYRGKSDRMVLGAPIDVVRWDPEEAIPPR